MPCFPRYFRKNNKSIKQPIMKNDESIELHITKNDELIEAHIRKMRHLKSLITTKSVKYRGPIEEYQQEMKSPNDTEALKQAELAKAKLIISRILSSLNDLSKRNNTRDYEHNSSDDNSHEISREEIINNTIKDMKALEDAIAESDRLKEKISEFSRKNLEEAKAFLERENPNRNPLQNLNAFLAAV